MRLIDADALIKKIFPYDVVDKKAYAINAKMIYEEINKAPTVDIKTEVAREIFAEIEQIIQGKLKTLSLFKEDEDDFYMGETHALEKLLAELKNKYIKDGVGE